MSKTMSRVDRLLKSVGAIPQSEEFRVGDEVVSKANGRSAIVMAVIPEGSTFKVKVAYTDKDEIGFLEPGDVGRA